jgi:hypothetical protein
MIVMKKTSRFEARMESTVSMGELIGGVCTQAAVEDLLPEVGNRDAISLLGRLSSGLLSILIASQFPSRGPGRAR